MKLDWVHEHVSKDFRVSSGDPSNEPNKDVLLDWHSKDPSFFCSLFISAEEASALGHALVRHGERIKEREQLTTEGVLNV